MTVCAVALAFTSCTDSEEVDLKYQVNVVVDPSEVIKSFNGFVYGDELLGLDMYDDTELALTSFVYDANGDLVLSKRGNVKDYTKKGSFSLSLGASDKYTIVTFSYAVLQDDGETYSNYSISDYNRLDKLTIEQNNPNSFYSNWSILGLDITTIDASQSDVRIDLEPATAMIELGFKKIHHYESAGVDNVFIAFGSNEKCRFTDNQPVYSRVGDVSYDRVYKLDLTNNQGSNNIGAIINVFPTQKMNYWAAACIGDYRYFEVPSKTIDVKAGSTYVINCYFNNKTIEAETLTRATANYSENNTNNRVLVTELYKNLN